MDYAIARVAMNTSTGNQDFTTTDLGGETPTGAVIMINYSITDGVVANDAAWSIGAVSGAGEQWACCGTSEDGAASTDVSRQATTTQSVLLLQPGSSSTECEASFVSFITNGVRLNITDPPAAAHLVEVLLFAGTGTECHAGTFAPGTTVDATVDVTAPGFAADFGIFVTHADDFDDVNSGNFIHGFGFAVNDGADTQRCILFTESQGSADGDPNAFLSTNYAIAALSNGTPNLNWACEIGSWDSSGFSSTLRLASAGVDEVGYFIVKTNGDDVYVGTHDTPTSSGNQSSTAPGHTPKFVLLGLTHLESVDTGSAVGDGGAIGVGVFTADSEYSLAFAVQNAAATTNTQSMNDDQAVNIPDHDGTTGVEAAFVSMDSNGWTLNFSQFKDPAKKFAVFSAGTVTTTIPVLDEGMLAGGLQPLGGGLG